MPSVQSQVRFAVIVSIGLCAGSFYAMGGFSKKPGHGAFDVDKPDSVQRGMDSADALRLSRLSKSLTDQNQAGKK